MVITEAIPNVRTPMWSTNDHGLQDTPCFAFRGWTWNHDFHWFTVFPSSTSNETMNSPTLSEKKQAKTLMNHSLRGSCETSDKPQDGIFLWLFVWLCFGCSKLPNRFFSTEFQMNRCFSMFFLVFFHRLGLRTTGNLLFRMGAFNLGSGLHGNSWPSGLSGDRAPDFHPKWHRTTMALSEGVTQNKPTTISPWFFKSNGDGWKLSKR